MSQDTTILGAAAKAKLDRRRLLGSAGLGAGALALATATAGLGFSRSARADTDPSLLTDVNILNFALNLEYLEAEFYLRAVNGTGLDPSNTTGTGNQGTVSGGSQVPFATAAVQQYAEEIASDEQAHVLFLRAALGEQAIAEPTIDLTASFTTAAVAAGLISAGDTFDPFANEENFLLGAFIFEDVGVTAYHGAAPFIQNKDYLLAAAGILGTEAYHASEVRLQLFQRGLGAATWKIAKARATLDGVGHDDQGVTRKGMANIVPTDKNGIVFARTPQQVLNIVYLGGAASNYGFFPNMLNGAIA